MPPFFVIWRGAELGARIGLIHHAPQMPRVKPPKHDKVMRGRPITTEELERMLAVVKKVRPDDADDWKLYLRGLWWGGLRLSESVALSWDDNTPFRVDCSAGSHPVFVIRAEVQKSQRDELLPMAPEFAELLERVPIDQRRGRGFRLLSRRGGSPMLPDAVGNIAGEIWQAVNPSVNPAEKPRRRPKTQKAATLDEQRLSGGVADGS